VKDKSPAQVCEKTLFIMQKWHINRLLILLVHYFNLRLARYSTPIFGDFMKITSALFLMMLMASVSAFAAAKNIDYTGPKDMKAVCGDAVIKKMQADDEIGRYLEAGMSVSLEWYDNEKSAVSFTFNFGEDVRDGYMTGDIAVKVAANGSCRLGKVLHSSVGD
jgi:hypothetical protein